MARAKKKDVVETATQRGIKFTLLGLLAGMVAGVAFALPMYLVGGAHWGAGGAIRAVLIGFPLGGLAGGLLAGFVLREGLGGLVEHGFQGGRGHTRSEHSWLQSMIMRGAYREAVAACAREAEASDDDPEPLILGAGVLRDHLHQYETAAQWLRRAREVKRLTAQQDITITRELVELYERELHTPRKALPELARVAETYPGTSAAEWARNTLKQLKAELWTDVKGGEADEASREDAPAGRPGSDPEG